MALLIGFGTEFYTLWEVETTKRFFTDGYGKHWHVGDDNKYTYIKNISTDLNKVKSLFPSTPIDEDLRGKTFSFSGYKKLPNPCPHILDFGKYCGQDVNDLVKTDFSYCLWLLDNAHDPALKSIVAALPEIVAYKAKLEADKDAYLATIPVIKESGIVELTVTSNAYHGEHGYFVNATLGDGSFIALIVEGAKLISGGYSYPDYLLPLLDGKAKRWKNKTIKVDLCLLDTTLYRNSNPRVHQVAKLISIIK